MKNLILLFGGNSFENDISIITAFSAYKAINRIYKIYPIYLKNEHFYFCKNIEKINNLQKNAKKIFREVCFSGGELVFLSLKNKKIPIYCVLNCCHGGSGENGDLAGLFDSLGVPYSSAPDLPSKIFMDKEYTKLFLEKNGFPFVDYFVIKKGKEIGKEVVYPVIIKPSDLGSSIGISFAHNNDEFRAGMENAFNFSDKIIVENALKDFTELNCAVYSRNGKTYVSNVEKVVYGEEFYDFDSKYKGYGTRREIPAVIDEGIYNKIIDITKEIYLRSGLKGVVRIDYLLSKEGELFVCEINTIPGSLAFYLYKDKLSFVKLISDIIEEGRRIFKINKKDAFTPDASFLRDFDFDTLDTGVKK